MRLLVPRGHLDPALRLEPPPQTPLDRVVERAEPAAVLLDQRPDRVEVGLLRGLGIFRVHVGEGIVDRAGVGAVAVYPVAEALGLVGRKNDVDFDLGPFLYGCVELE